MANALTGEGRALRDDRAKGVVAGSDGSAQPVVKRRASITGGDISSYEKGHPWVTFRVAINQEGSIYFA